LKTGCPGDKKEILDFVNGIINIYKEKGFTSHDVVAKMRGILKMKKIGHTGTLDPEAEGVLPVCLGKGTRLVDLITDKNKTYEAVMKLGVVTDTQDLTGELLRVSEVNVKLPEITEAIQSFIGEYDQLPPMYSAVKVNGKKLYELARQGKEIERKTRRVRINDIRLLAYSEDQAEVTISVDCGKGTYIRTLIHDIGDKLGCGAAMKSLIRTRVGSFTLKEALKLSQVEELMRQDRLSEYILPPDVLFSDYPKLMMDEKHDKLIHNGNALSRESVMKMASEARELSGSPYRIRVYDSGREFVGIYEYDPKEETFRPYKMFL
jgi:tRNA pseudouridine55 synthase